MDNRLKFIKSEITINKIDKIDRKELRRESNKFRSYIVQSIKRGISIISGKGSQVTGNSHHAGSLHKYA
jgi:hypothetical protein